MDIFGHVGLTLGVAYAGHRAVGEGLLGRYLGKRAGLGAGTQPGASTGDTEADAPLRFAGVDYRLLIVGSVIPDLIDKPIGLWLAPDLVNGSTRGIAHSLAFALVLLAVLSFAFRPRFSPSSLALGLGNAGHLLLDQMWGSSRILLWPFLGSDLPQRARSISQYADSKLWDVLKFYADPPELIGAILILALAVKLLRDRAVRGFLRSGAVT